MSLALNSIGMVQEITLSGLRVLVLRITMLKLELIKPHMVVGNPLRIVKLIRRKAMEKSLMLILMNIKGCLKTICKPLRKSCNWRIYVLNNRGGSEGI